LKRLDTASRRGPSLPEIPGLGVVAQPVIRSWRLERPSNAELALGVDEFAVLPVRTRRKHGPDRRTLSPTMNVMRGEVSLPVPRALLLVAVLAFLFYAPSWEAYFVSDDYEFLGRIKFTEAARYWTQSWGYGNEYRPLLVYTYALNAIWSGSSP